MKYDRQDPKCKYFLIFAKGIVFLSVSCRERLLTLLPHFNELSYDTKFPDLKCTMNRKYMIYEEPFFVHNEQDEASFFK